MIKIGLTTWSEHQDLVHKKKITLIEYASKLPLVEIDSSFYGIPRRETVLNWIEDTPSGFSFLVKAHKSMTLHENWQEHFASEAELFKLYLDVFTPLIHEKKLFAFLFQFPPYFSCTKENIRYLRKLRLYFKELPIAIELRNGSWYEERYCAKMLEFMQQNDFILTIVDEPQIPMNSVPFLVEMTSKEKALFRLHGRNVTGWMNKQEDWRKKRTLYNYNEAELAVIGAAVQKIAQEVREVGVIFNNNSGGHAAKNGLKLQSLLKIQYEGLNPEQMDLF